MGTGRVLVMVDRVPSESHDVSAVANVSSIAVTPDQILYSASGTDLIRSCL
jgi:hypothetical protein